MIDIPLKPVTPAPDCEYQRIEVNGVPWCACNWCPCDKVPGCGYDPRPSLEAIRKERVTVEDRMLPDD